MSNAETPAENPGGNTATPATTGLGELPPRVRVHALAKLLGSTSKDILAALTEMGETTRSAQSSVSREVAHRVAKALGVDAGPAEQAEAPVAAQPETAAAQPETAAPATDEASEAPAPRTRRRGRANPESGLPTPTPVVATPAAESSALQAPVFAPPSPIFLPPEPVAPAKSAPAKSAPAKTGPAKDEQPKAVQTEEDLDEAERASTEPDDDSEDGGGRRRRRRGRRGRGRGKGGDDLAKDEGDESDERDESATGSATDEDSDEQDESTGEAEGDTDSDDGEGGTRRRRRRRRRRGADGDGAQSEDDPPNTVVHVRETTRAEDARDQVRSVRGSTRLEAKRQRRRDGREAGRRRAPILSEAEFLARRESVERTMVVRESAPHGKGGKDRTTQIGVLEDGVLVEHFVTSSGSGSIVGNVYLGRVQNVLPSMEAAFVDIGRGRNAVLYAGEVDWDAAGLEGKSRKIEQALSTGDSVLVQVTKDPVGHKGARLTTQISLPGRFLVYVPGGGAAGISRKLPENERRRLKDILKRIVPDDAGVIIRTASEGIVESELERDVRRLQAQWEIIKEKSAGSSKKAAPTLLYEEPDLLVKVVRDLFTEDFTKLIVQGSVAWETIDAYVQHVAPDLAERLERYHGKGDVFSDHRIDEQITKALDRKVWLPSGGYLVIDRTEAMTVIDVNTGKYTGSGGNLEETVTRNNLEAAEEIVRQLRLRDIGGIIVIDFIDMVLESNRDLVLRRLTECLGRDRTRHQVAEVTSLGLVQMTRKRVGTGLLEAFSNTCEHCKGRGVTVSTDSQPAASGPAPAAETQQGGRKRGKGKAEEEPIPVVRETTPEQRESVVSAVQAMVNAASKASTKDSSDQHDGAADAAQAGGRQAAAPESAPEAALTGSAPQETGTPEQDVSAKSAPEKSPRRRERRASRRESGAPSSNGLVRPERPAEAAGEVPAEVPAERPLPTGSAPQPAGPEATEPAPAVAEPAVEAPAAEPAPEVPAAESAPEATPVAAGDEAPAPEVAAEAPAEAPQATETPAEAPQPTEAAPESVEEPVAAGAAEERSVVRTVTRRLRRAASRPAGPPVGANAGVSAEAEERQ